MRPVSIVKQPHHWCIGLMKYRAIGLEFLNRFKVQKLVFGVSCFEEICAIRESDSALRLLDFPSGKPSGLGGCLKSEKPNQICWFDLRQST